MGAPRCLPVPVLALYGANSPRGIHRWLDRRGTSPFQVLAALGTPWCSRRPARLREIIPRSHPERYRDPRGHVKRDPPVSVNSSVHDLLPWRLFRGCSDLADGVGYKLHIDVADGQIPISCLLTSAALHDSQAAIPLATLSAERTTNLYDLMDAAYDAEQIREHSRSLGHVPLIDVNPRGDKARAEELRTETRRLKNLGFQRAEQVRYNELGRDAGTEVGFSMVPRARFVVCPGVPRAPRIATPDRPGSASSRFRTGGLHASTSRYRR